MGFLSEGFYCLFCVSHEISSAFKSKKVAICRCCQKNGGLLISNNSHKNIRRSANYMKIPQLLCFGFKSKSLFKT